ncbi:hypothetical protein [Trichlorobacter lovleyi]|jgi:hypothetical protein|uniref:Uncharacterized protein n=1 Tax=Trichlorobacter lovleyi (strain ATCC BAA-1151 / DSM 17278 / SZ) TaxID=398767 RepID=B3E7X9_TRIL1|nr:hypothetical protein [Trichlorobacter lovleyi]ACD96552.1 hypothetical protein Glov_2839 [Trichlorobacter lovleyi SZ]
MFETQYNEEMEAEVRRLDAKQRAISAGHPEWDNACKICYCRLEGTNDAVCVKCAPGPE